MKSQLNSRTHSETNNFPKAKWTTRVGAYLLDALAAAVLGFIVYIIVGQKNIGLTVFEVFFLFNFCLGWRFGGQTIGMRLLNIRVVTTQGQSLGWGRTIWRYIAFTISLFSVIGMVWILIDKQKQGLHDKLAGTYVIK